MHLNLFAARAAAVVALSCASIPISSLVVYADANPNNHGHHYGQLKHQHPPTPAPQPQPAPKPNPPAVAPTVSHPNVAITPTTAPAAPSESTLPLPNLGGQNTPRKQVVAAPPPGRDPNLWIVEALLPALLVAWLILLAASRGLRQRKPDGQAPAG